MRSAATSARMVFASFEYTTAPPLKYSLAPPCAVSTAARSPPVHDSAAATVSLRRRSREWSAPMRSSSSGRVGGRLFGTKHESDARQHGQRGRGHQDSVGGRREAGGRPGRRSEKQGDRRDLQDRLGLAVHGRADGVVRTGAYLDRDELPGEDEDDRPGRRDPAQCEGGKGADDEDLVRERVQRGAKRGRATAASRERSVQGVGCGSAEEHEQGQGRVAARDQTDHGYDENGSRGGERVRDCHCATKTRSTTSPCLPSPAVSWPL